jgi:hypothetical protein
MYELTPSLLFDIYLLQQHASDQGDERYHTTWVKKKRGKACNAFAILNFHHTLARSRRGGLMDDEKLTFDVRTYLSQNNSIAISSENQYGT